MKQNMKSTVCIILLLLCIMFPFTLKGQVTTSSIVGHVIDDENNDVIGAQVVAIHTASGTRYVGTTNKDGLFQLFGLRIGGPYEVTVSYIGFKNYKVSDITLHLGEPMKIDAKMALSTELSDVVVVGHSRDLHTGASSFFTHDQIMSMPNINRSIEDIDRMSPYYNGSGYFAGRDKSYNNYMVDGASFNDNMGLDKNSLPGNGSPISIDAIEEVHIAHTPFDVSQSNFIGATTNIVTKSGSNTFSGSAYTYWKNEHLRGKSIAGVDLGDSGNDGRTVYGITLGGPILKDKLFFFINGEYEYAPSPIQSYSLSDDGNYNQQKNITRVTAADMQRFSNALAKYGWNPGSYTDYDGKQHVYRLNTRFDWNINDKHKLMLRYNMSSSSADNNVSGASMNGRAQPVSLYSMAFRGSTWQKVDKVYSLTAELNSNLGVNMHNKLTASFTFSDINNRKCDADFPAIDIYKTYDGDDYPYMYAGYDQYAYNNGIKDRTWNFANDFTMSLGKHNLTAGLALSTTNASNCFMRYGAGYYRYASLEDFENGAAPTAFALCYSLTGNKKALSDVKYSKFSIYLQDEYLLSDKLNVQFGVRMELPWYSSHRYENPSIADIDFNGTRLNTGRWPKAMPMFSPRVGFSYDAFGDGRLIVRGGTGLFAGRFPLIYLSKMQEGSGMLQATAMARNTGSATQKAFLAELAGGVRTTQQVLDELAPKYPEIFATKAGDTHNIVAIDNHFKMPQVWSSTLAADYRLPLPFSAVLTLEGTFSRNINAITQYDANIDNTKITNLSGPDTRNYYAGNTGMRINEDINYAVVMTNTSRGYSAILNATLKAKPFRWFELMAAYTHTLLRTLNNNASNQEEKILAGLPTVDGLNCQRLGGMRGLHSPGRLMAMATFTKEYNKHNAIQITLFYEGQHGGCGSFIYANDLNNDGYTNDLLYIPANKDELLFSDKKVGNTVFTADEQRDAFWKFVNQDPYLSSHKGEYARAFSAYTPWYNRFDLHVMREFRMKIGKSMNRLQISADLLNIGNLLKSKWGVMKTYKSGTLTPLRVASYQTKEVTEGGTTVTHRQPVFEMSSYTDSNGNVKLIDESFDYYYNNQQCWQLQLGVKYVFN